MEKRSKIMMWATLWILFLGVPFLCFAETNKPVASFNFTKTSYQVNEPVEVIDTSKVANGGKIARREWSCVIGGKEKTSTNIKTLMSQAKQGTYSVSLRVRDNSGTWGEPVKRQLKIVEAKPLRITSFKSGVSVYNIGQKLELDYTYDNPNDLEIASQRWRYRNISTNGSTISGKPKYFKKAGTYEISLELQDEWGNWSNKVSVQIVVSNEVTERDGYYLFEKGKQGDLVEDYVDKDYNSFEQANIVSTVDLPGTLLMSNAPETIPSSGILYRDTTKGAGRVIVHHANGTVYNKKFMILVSNQDKKAVTLNISNMAIVGPGRHTLKLGQSAVYNYLTGSSSKAYTIGPGETICVYNSGTWKPQEVVTGTLDFASEGNIKWQMVAMDEKSSLSNLSMLAVLPRDTHDRGTFNVLQREYVVDLTNVTDLKKLVIGREKEEWVKGVDALTGDEIQDRGNYGIPIKITVKNNQDMGVIINARGGAYLGALKWNGKKVFNVPNEEILKEHEVAALVGDIRANTANEIIYMLPNGSSAPILFGFIPKNMWK